MGTKGVVILAQTLISSAAALGNYGIPVTALGIVEMPPCLAPRYLCSVLCRATTHTHTPHHLPTSPTHHSGPPTAFPNPLPHLKGERKGTLSITFAGGNHEESGWY